MILPMNFPEEHKGSIESRRFHGWGPDWHGIAEPLCLAGRIIHQFFWTYMRLCGGRSRVPGVSTTTVER